MASFATRLWRRLAGFWNPPRYQHPFFVVESLHLARAYFVAAELGIADLLAERPLSLAQLAQATGSDARALARYLRLLAAFGVFALDADQKYRPTRRSRLLQTGVPGSIRSWLIFQGRSELWQGFACTIEGVKTGVPPFQLAHGRGFYEHLDAHPELGQAFFGALGDWSDWHCHAIVKAFDFSRFGIVIDVGGGLGTLLQKILTAYPSVRGILFDRAEAIQLARPRFVAAGLAERCQFIGGNFLDTIPGNADAYVIKHVLNDWDDERVKRILANCHAAMPSGASLLIAEAVVDERNRTDRIVKLLDLELGALLPGGMRTQAEFRSLLAASGFQLVQVHPTAVLDLQIVEARRVAVSSPAIHRPAPAAPIIAAPNLHLGLRGSPLDLPTQPS